ncbi:hypothetical protein BH11PSE9_BH11PSE9_17160 [soil metagenome]
MKLRLGFLVLAALLAPLAHAQAVSYVGALDPENPNDVFITSFTLAAPSAVTIQTWSFGGGPNAAGTVIADGGFDPYVSLFRGEGTGATFLASNDDGLCPPRNAALACADSTVTIGSLAIGTYTLALTLPFNYSFAENYGSGTLGDGFIGLDSSFDDGSCAATCTNAYAVDITYAVPVPEPATWALFGSGMALLAVARRRG